MIHQQAFSPLQKRNGRGADYSKYQVFGGNNQPWYINRKSIKTVNVEEGVVQIGSYWFYDCTNLTTVNFNSSTLDTLGEDLFRGCTSLQSINLPENATYYYKELFLDCTSLKYVSLPSTNNTDTYKNKIPDGIFSGCTSLEQVYVGSGHTGIDNNAFKNCSKLKSIVWTSDNLSSVASNALSSVPSSCKLVGTSSLVNATSALSFQNVNGFCGTALSYKYDAQNKK
ncbi:MAG: leucine-rich repeat domain-containing protein, partial [Eubacterium sp.]